MATARPPPVPGSLAAEIDAVKKTPVTQRPTTRLVDMKVLVLGLCRTGTYSIRDALYTLGYNDVYHMASIHEAKNGETDYWTRAYEHKIYGTGKPLSQEEWNQLLGYCEAVTDVPPVNFVHEMLDLYPDAKIILSVRDSPASWHKSMLDTVYYHRQLAGWMRDGLVSNILHIVMALPPQAMMLRHMCHCLFGGSGNAFERDGEQFYVDHNMEVKRAAGSRPVLTFNVKEGWGPLCEFLGKDIPDVPFPRTNDAETFRGRIVALRQRQTFFSVYGPFLLKSVEVAGVIGLAAWLWQRYKP